MPSQPSTSQSQAPNFLVSLYLAVAAAHLIAAAPCDIYSAGGTPCIAAHSTTRALYSAYTGPLYTIKRLSDNATTTVSPLSAGGIANATTQDVFCTTSTSTSTPNPNNKGTCLITIIHDQSGRGNHLTQAPPGGFRGPEPGGYDRLADAFAAPISLSLSLSSPPNPTPKKAYGVYIPPGTGYRNNSPNGTARADEPEGMYAVLDGTHYNSGCCFDYGNAETNSRDTGNGHMEAIYFGNNKNWGSGAGKGPWIMADLENGLFSGVGAGNNPGDPSIVGWRFVTAVVKGGANRWAIRGGDAGKAGGGGKLETFYNGVRPSRPGYNPMRKEGAIILGIGGDNSVSGRGTFYEGVMTRGYPDDATEDAVQADVLAAGYAVL